MCGIAGIISCTRNYSERHLKTMADSLAHRGPDGEGFWTDENAGIYLGHRRLAIIDLSAEGSQPMHYLDRYVIIHNGEVYNYLELRSLLEKKGYHFRSSTDTEVIAAAYDHWGSACPEQFEGMFAFAIWDRKEKNLFLARDRMGEKPLYYTFNPATHEVFFASELKALWAIGLPRSFDKDMLAAFLTLGITVHPEDISKTFYQDYYQLKPGHYCIIDPKSVSEIRSVPYWTCSAIINAQYSDEKAVSLFQQHFFQSVAHRLRSDVTVGTSLSGGLDSSSVVAAIHRENSSLSHYTQHCFTAVFPGFEKNEAEPAQQLANLFGLHQHLVIPTEQDFADILPKLLYIHEEPFGSASVYAQFKVFEEAKNQGVKVLLDGQGADELVGGYSKYKHWLLQELLLKSKFKTFLQEKTAFGNQTDKLSWGPRNYLAAFFPEKASQYLHDRNIKRIKSNPDLDPSFANQVNTETIAFKPVIRQLNDVLYYDSFQSGLNELLRYADKNSMANSCELRLPFLYHPLIEFVFSLPAQFKIRDGYTKWLLRQSMKDLIPASITQATNKIGFEPPQEKWMQHKPVIDLVQNGKENLYKMGVLNKKTVSKKIQPHTAYAAEGKDWRYLTAGLLVS